MKKIILNQNTVSGFLGILRKLITRNSSIIFPHEGEENRSSKFGKIRKISSRSPMKLTTHRLWAEPTKEGIRLTNPLNEGFGYSEITIPFGVIISAYNSFFWKDEHGYWRQMQFSKQLGWALKVTGGVTEDYYPPKPRIEIRSRFAGRVEQFYAGTGDW